VISNSAIKHARSAVAEIVRAEGLRAGQTFLEHHSGHGGSWSTELTAAGLVPAQSPVGVDLVVDVHYLMHETNLDRVIANHAAALGPRGVLVCEFFYAAPMITNALVDTIRHGHYLYLTLTAAVPAWRRNGLVITAAAESAEYGGSLQVSARFAATAPRRDPSVQRILDRERQQGLDRASTLEQMAQRARQATRAFREELIEFQRRGMRVVGYGAPSKASVLLTLAGVDNTLLPSAVDRSPTKAGMRIPGTQIRIDPPEALLALQPDIVVVLTWDIADEVADQLRGMFSGQPHKPTLYVPLPTPRTITL
jgi:hypothetical protein